MKTEDITTYYFEHFQPSQQRWPSGTLRPPIIQSWRCIKVKNQIVIRGKIFNHPKYPAGKHLKSSPIQECLNKAGRVYVTTRNSIYELGTPHPNLVSNTHREVDGPKNHEWEKLTYWGE